MFPVRINPGIWGRNLARVFDRGTIQGHGDSPKACDENDMPRKDSRAALIEFGMKTLKKSKRKDVYEIDKRYVSSYT